MTDELKPELKDALNKLPRERIPEGLEAKVTDAMRDRGFLEKRRRVVAVTSGRVASLLAACVALAIGAYSIGLHRGGSDAAFLHMDPLEANRQAPAGEPRGDAAEPKTHAPETSPDAPADVVSQLAAEPPPSIPERRALAPESERAPEPVATDERMDGDRLDRYQEIGEVAEDTGKPEAGAGAPAAGREETMADAQARKSRAMTTTESVQRSQSRPATQPGRPSTYTVNGTPVIVDAPDSVRVDADEHGHVLLIYTSDGVIRVYLPNR